jgi:tRNA-2-methylthio-N6-dimethylallyladenosine synthase
VEGRVKDKWYGRTRTDKPVFFSSDHNHKGKLVEIKISKTSPWSLQGEIAPGRGVQEEK